MGYVNDEARDQGLDWIDANGTRYVRVRPSGDTAWTASEIIGAPDLTISNVEAG